MEIVYIYLHAKFHTHIFNTFLVILLLLIMPISGQRISHLMRFMQLVAYLNLLISLHVEKLHSLSTQAVGIKSKDCYIQSLLSNLCDH